MTSEETHKQHQKHASLARPGLGEFGRSEIAVLGTTCANIRNLAYKIIRQLTHQKIAYVDADHKGADDVNANSNTALSIGGSFEYTDKIHFHRFDIKATPNTFQRRILFNEQDLVIVNGNHFKAKAQIVVIDPVKNLEKKTVLLTNVQLIILKEKDAIIPDCIKRLPGFNSIPVLPLDNENNLFNFFAKFLEQSIPRLNGLVLSGGHSTRMKKDKGSLHYHGADQRHFLYQLLSKYSGKTYVSCNAQQVADLNGQCPIIEDAFLNLGPLGGILSALQLDPTAAWLTVACDLPYLSEKSIDFLVKNRNPSKVATAFLDSNRQFPEPLITVWEPKSYPILLQFLAQGYSCPRKALINSDIELLNAPHAEEFFNANEPEDYEKAVRQLNNRKTV